MERAADAVAHEGAHDPEAVRLDVSLDRVRHVGQPPSGPALLDGQLEAFARDVEELPDGRGDVAERHREGTVGVVPFHDTPEIKAHDVAGAQAALGRRDPVHDLLVDGDAHGGREPPVALERGPRATLDDEPLDFGVHLECRQPRFHERAQSLHHVGQDVTGPAHELDLPWRLALDAPHGGGRHRPSARRTASPMASTVPTPGTETRSEWFR